MSLRDLVFHTHAHTLTPTTPYSDTLNPNQYTTFNSTISKQFYLSFHFDIKIIFYFILSKLFIIILFYNYLNF